MQNRKLQIVPAILVPVLVLVTIFVLSRPRELTGNPTGEVKFIFPEELGAYHSEPVFFCKNDQCARIFTREQLKNPEQTRLSEQQNIDLLARNMAKNTAPQTELPESLLPAPGEPSCPVCNAALSGISIGEMKLLPPSTPLFRTSYRHPGGEQIAATLVFSGLERRSIHRPQVCLVAQGNRIINEYDHEARIGFEKTKTVRVLELTVPIRNREGKVVGQSASVYCYWLFNPEYETTSHLMRFARYAFDNCFRSYRPRWGYASISIPVSPQHSESWKETLDDFLPYFDPLVTKLRKEMDLDRGKKILLDGSSAEQNRYDGSRKDVNFSEP